MKDKNNQKICCEVENCIHHNDEDLCKLKEIEVKCNCGCAHHKDDTICNSYKKKDE